MTDIDPLDAGVPRGRYGRPLIIPTKRSGVPDLKAKLVEYDRASTVADALDTGGGLATWKTRHAALGIASNPDLAALVAALGSNLNTFSSEDKTNLDAIIDRAHDRSGGNEKADYGTAVHSLTEPGNDGTVVIDSMTGDVESYVATLDEAGIEVVATEQFIVNDALKVAGTFDHVYQFNKDVTVKLNGVDVVIAAGSDLIGDKKTGSLHFDAHAIQLAIYARGQAYDHTTGERTALDVSPQYGVIAHVAREGAKTTLHLIDLAAGWHGAKLAVQAREYTLGARKRLSAVIATCEAPAPIDPAPAAAKLVEIVAPLEDTRDVFDGGDVLAAEWPLPATAAKVDQEVADMADAVATVTQKLDAVSIDQIIHRAIAGAEDADACRALWTQYRECWKAEHTELVKTRVAAWQAAA